MVLEVPELYNLMSFLAQFVFPSLTWTMSNNMSFSSPHCLLPCFHPMRVVDSLNTPAVQSSVLKESSLAIRCSSSVP